MPTGIGGIIGLNERGEIKTLLSEEAEMEAQMLEADEQSSLLDALFAMFVGSAQAQEVQTWTDEFSFKLKPSEGVEWKLVMEERDTAEYTWSAEAGGLKYDLQGDGSGQSTSYEDGRGQISDEGTTIAAFIGNHGGAGCTGPRL